MIETVAETGSTNADLLARLRAGSLLREGDWLVAERQSAGRGRQGRNWFDGTGNFMGSTVVHSAASDPPAHTLALVAGLAAYETVLPFCPEAGALMLKWPNDLLLAGAKLAGILLESANGSVVVGIGVNLKVAPQLTDRKTIALADIAPPPSRDDFAVRLAAVFDAEVERWRSHGLELLLRRWQAAAHGHGASLKVHDPSGSTLVGSFVGLDASGSLLLRDPDGKTHTVHAGDVVME